MWQPLSNLFNQLGKLRFAFRPSRVELTVGNPNERDAMDSAYWKDYLKPEKLFEVWGPVSGSAWEPYHCVPLFAALKTLPDDRTGPTDPLTVREIEGNGHLTNSLMSKEIGREWVLSRTWIILDLPGATSVALSVRLIAAGYQPVCTFDHWPHPRGLLKPEIILAQLLRYAANVNEYRRQLDSGSPPLWICDRNRLGSRAGSPRDFDNRYYLDDSVLPSPEVLRRADIQQIICIVPSRENKPREDLCAYFRDLRRENYAALFGVALNDPELTPFQFPEEMFHIKFDQSGYRRSDAGGFGLLIPEPSSSSG